MNVHTIVVGAFEVNCFVAVIEGSSALVIDPGSDPDRISAFLEEQKLTPCAYLMTHGHVDHISGLYELHQAFPAPIALHEADESWAFSKQNEFLPYYKTPAKPEKIGIGLQSISSIPNLNAVCLVLPTPGHTPGSVCFHFPEHNILFTGDTLFAGSAGRTDLPGGSSRQLSASLKSLRDLPDNTQIMPGHGQSSTIGHEKRTNYFMQG